MDTITDNPNNVNQKENNLWDETKSITRQRNCVLPTTKNECAITTETNELNETVPSTDITKTKIAGIYKIVNKINGKYYVGSSNDIVSTGGRWWEHRHKLKRNIHNNHHLQRAWNKYGENNFEWIIIAQNISPNNLRKIEQMYLNICRQNPRLVYNEIFEAVGSNCGVLNHNYKKVSRMIQSEAKQIWINSGSTKLYQFMRRLGYGSKTTQRLLGIFKSDVKSFMIRKINSRNLRIKIASMPSRKIRRGKNHPEYDHTKYLFQNIITNEFFHGTTFDFSHKYDLYTDGPRLLVKKRILKLNKQWIFIKN